MRRTRAVAALGAGLAALWSAVAAAGDGDRDRRFTLSAPAALADSGLLDHLLPRFSLKTATRVERLAPEAPADARFGGEGAAVIEGPGRTWHLALSDDPDAAAFAEWLGSDPGRAAVESFADGQFAAVSRRAAAAAEAAPEGDAARGAKLALAHCGRCHVVGPENRMDAIGSTPSFAVLRGLPDWAARFEGFYTLNPHPAFTQVAEVTPPFPAASPPPIVPLQLTLDEIGDIAAFAAGIAPADLGAPIRAR